MNLGAKLKDLRIQSGLNQKQLADQLGVTKSVISYYESLERSPSPDVLIRYATVFHVSVDYLLGLDRTKSIDISDLTAEEERAVRVVIDTFRSNRSK